MEDPIKEDEFSYNYLQLQLETAKIICHVVVVLINTIPINLV
jgi:hypothetical protein